MIKIYNTYTNNITGQNVLMNHICFGLKEKNVRMNNLKKRVSWEGRKNTYPREYEKAKKTRI